MIDLNVRENAALTALDRLKIGPDRQPAPRGRPWSSASCPSSAVKAPSLEAPVSALSGGNQQKVVMARAMLSEPAHPRRGRADAGRRRRRPRRDLPHPARGRRPRRAGGRRFERRAGARGPVRPRDRDVRGHAVATLEGDDGEGGADRPGRDQRDDAHRRADGATSRRGSSRLCALHRGRLRAGRHPRGS